MGKTSIVKSMLNQYDEYRRPMAYTTRSRRNEEEATDFIFTNNANILQLYADGKLLVLDEVYGNKYALSRVDVEEILASKKTALKEMHVRDHASIKDLIPDSVSIAILPSTRQSYETQRNKLASSSERFSQERESDLAYHLDLVPGVDVDIIILNDFKQSITEISSQLHEKLRDFTSWA